MGVAHIDEDGRQPHDLDPVAETRAKKRAVKWATGGGVSPFRTEDWPVGVARDCHLTTVRGSLKGMVTARLSTTDAHFGFRQSPLGQRAAAVASAIARP